MKRFNLMLLSVAVMYGEKIMNGNASVNGVEMTFETRLEPGSPAIHRHGGGTLTEKGVMKRHLCNFDNNSYFGYDLTMEPLADGRVKLRFAPLSITPAKMSEIFREVPNWTSLARPAGPASVEVRPGETVALDLFVNTSTGQKVTDYVTINGAPAPQVAVQGPAHDFAPEDATMEISAPRVSVDGKREFSWDGRISGHATWVDLPRPGRFVLSLVPRQDLGMQRLGEIRGNRMGWRSGGHEYAIATDRPVATGSRAYHLYVFAIPRAVTQFELWAGPRPDDGIRRR